MFVRALKNQSKEYRTSHIRKLICAVYLFWFALWACFGFYRNAQAKTNAEGKRKCVSVEEDRSRNGIHRRQYHLTIALIAY